MSQSIEVSLDKTLNAETVKRCTSADATQRLDSVDASRGLTMAAMLFCNFLSDGIFRVDDVPGWLRHASEPDTMTIPDVIWPAFAFLMGLSLPLAVENRQVRSQSTLQIAWHVVTRSLSLMILGVFIGNAWASSGQGHPVGMDATVWRLLTIAGFVLIWNRYGAVSDRGKWWAIAARTTGVALLVYLATIYREGDDLHGLQIRWWILGTLGWAYLVAGIVCLIFHKHRAAILGCLALTVLMYVGDQGGAFNRLTWLGPVRNCASFGTLLGVWPAMTLAGVFVGMLFTAGSPVTGPRTRVTWIVAFAIGLFWAGFLLRPLYGCSKGEQTPTWALFSVAISCAIFVGIHLLVDVWHKRAWVAVLLPVGTNAMLAYLLHETLHPLMPFLNIRFESAGVMGITRAAVFAVGVLTLTTYCTNRRILRMGL